MEDINIEETNNEFYDKGLDVIQKTRDVRNKINKTSELIANAEFRLSQVPEDEYWTNVKQENIKNLEELHKEEDSLKEELHDLKDKMDKDFYRLLLQHYGSVLGSTSPIEHVKDNLYDEFELNRAIRETEVAIRATNEELQKAIEDDNEDYAIILSSQIHFYRSDLKQHFWGEEILKKVDKELTSTVGRVK